MAGEHDGALLQGGDDHIVRKGLFAQILQDHAQIQALPGKLADSGVGQLNGGGV